MNWSAEFLIQFLTLPSSNQSKIESPVALTPMLTPTPVNAGELPDTLDRQNGPLLAPSCTSLNGPERKAAGSKTAGCRFDSCPTCPRNPEFMGVTALCPRHNVHALTPS